MKLPRFLAVAIIIIFAFTSVDSLAGSGEWDRTFAPVVVGGAVYATAVQPDGMLVVGGSFASVDGSSAHDNLARLYPDGTLDSTFSVGSAGFSGTVWSLALQSNGSIVIGGSFGYLNGVYRYNVARLNSNGTVDGSFVPTNAINSSVLALAIQSNNAVIIGGTFGNGQIFPDNLARLNADGTTDTSFSAIVNGAVYAIAIQPNGQIVIGGTFTLVDGANRYHIARLNTDGSLDATFQNGLSGASSNVRSIQIQGNGEVLIGGDFTVVNGASRNYVARLTTTGTLDTGFAANNSGANGSVYAMAVQSDGEVLIGGIFSAYSGGFLSRVARLYDDGTRDTTFTNFGINNIVESLAIQNDGSIITGGTFTTVNNTNWPCLASLYGDLYPPEFVTQPVSVNTNIGATVTFSAHVSNQTATSFQWLKDGVDIPDATDTTYSLFNVQTADSGTYSVSVTDDVGGTTSSNAVLQVGIAPTITSQPSSLTVTQGQSASFSITATGTQLNYFWRNNGAFVPGQTNSMLTYAAVDPTNAGTYTCLVSNFLGTVTSTGAVLTIFSPPVISVEPMSQMIELGSNFTVSVTASGYPALSYQWRTNGGPIPGATVTNYSVATAQITDAGAYDVVISNAFGSITSSVANISVGFPPIVVQQPFSITNAPGDTAGLSCVVTGSAPISLQWTFYGNPILNATNSNLTLTNLQPGNIGFYALTATNGFGGTVSSNAALNLIGYPFGVWNGLLAFYPFAGNANDASGNGNNGTNYGATFVQNRFGITNAAAYFNGSDILTGFFPPLGAAARTFSGWFQVAPSSSPMALLAYGGNSSSAGDRFELDLGYYIPGAFYVNGSVFGGWTATAYDDSSWHNFIIVVPQNAALSNAIIYMDVILQTNLFLSGSADTFNTAQVNPLQFGQEYLSGGFGPLAGSLSDIRVYNRALSSDEVAELYALDADVPIVTQPPQPQMVDLGGTANFSVAATAVHPLFYQWQTNGTPIPGATNALLTLTNVQQANVGLYSVTVSNGFVGVSSSAVTLAVQPALIIASSSSQNLNLNLTGLPQTSYVLQSATNLTPPIIWQPVLTNQTDTNGLWQFSDTNLNSPQKYYRVTTP